MKYILYIVFFLLSLKGIAQNSNTLTVKFNGLESKKGNVYVALYNSEATFLKQMYKGVIVTIKNGSATALFNDLASGIYAVSAYYDKNNNGKLDTNFMGIPKEPTAISNDAPASFGPPKFKAAKFKLNSNKTIEMNF